VTKTLRNRLAGPLCAALFFSCSAVATEIRVEIGSTRAPYAVGRATDNAARDFARHVSALGSGVLEAQRKAGFLKGKLAIPTRIVLTDHGHNLPFRGRGPGDLVPTFDASGNRSFEASYKQYLQRVFTAAMPVMDSVFGMPAKGGVVRVRNYDADIQDRYAVGGGYYVPNGPGPEIRFPVYNNKVSAGVNYIHTLLLAYMADKQYPWDAYNEGLARAATMIVCRTPGALPDNPDKDQIEAALASVYDVGAFYDWYNNVGIGGPQFIAPNLLNIPLPLGGSTGGIFLLRYQMSGTAWAKVAIRYSGFLAQMNSRFYANPSLYQTTAELEALAQTALDAAAGTANTPIEGLKFTDWAQRQAILDTRLTPGLKLVAEPLPIVAQAGSSDFGVFNVVLNAFTTKANGDEILLAGSCFPIFWRPDYSRFFTSAQDDVLRIAGAYGSVTPNFPGDTFQQKPYRVTVDLPLFGKTARTFLPSGTYSLGGDPTPKSFIGTLIGVPDAGTVPYKVNVAWLGGSKNGIAVSNFAFGYDITDAGFLAAGAITVRVLQGTTEVIRREIVKTPGQLALNLAPTESVTSYTLARPNRLDMKSLPLDPFRPNPADILGLADNDTLFAHWNSNFARYDLYPDEGEFRSGLGYWVRPATAANRVVKGLSFPRTPVAVSLNPGWNQVAVPFNSTITTTSVLVTVSTESIGTYAEATDDGTLGTTIFQFSPDTTDKDAGTMIPATSFEPGKAYFVRANRPEGAVLIFVPPGGPNKTRSRGGSIPVYHLVWETKVSLLDANGKSCNVSIGQAGGASRGFDPALDSDLPPMMPGMQIAVRNNLFMFRDMRQSGTAESYVLDLKGLIPGKRYALRFKPIAGSKQLGLDDRGNVVGVSSNQDYGFVASSSSMRMTVMAGRNQ